MDRMALFVEENLSGYNLPAHTLAEIKSILLKRFRAKFSEGLSPEGRLAMEQAAKRDIESAKSTASRVRLVTDSANVTSGRSRKEIESTKGKDKLNNKSVNGTVNNSSTALKDNNRMGTKRHESTGGRLSPEIDPDTFVQCLKQLEDNNHPDVLYNVTDFHVNEMDCNTDTDNETLNDERKAFKTSNQSDSLEVTENAADFATTNMKPDNNLKHQESDTENSENIQI